MLYKPTGPAYLYGIDFSCRAQTEVHAQIVLGNVARPAAHFIHQSSLPNFDGDLCADPVTIGARSHSFESGPVVVGMRRIYQQAGPCVHVVDEHGESSIVPKITHSQAAS